MTLINRCHTFCFITNSVLLSVQCLVYSVFYHERNIMPIIDQLGQTPLILLGYHRKMWLIFNLIFCLSLVFIDGWREGFVSNLITKWRYILCLPLIQNTKLYNVMSEWPYVDLIIPWHCCTYRCMDYCHAHVLLYGFFSSVHCLWHISLAGWWR